MMLLPAIIAALNVRKNMLLLFAQASLSPQQFRAFRKLLLRELGRDGLERELVRIIGEHDEERKR